MITYVENMKEKFESPRKHYVVNPEVTIDVITTCCDKLMKDCGFLLGTKVAFTVIAYQCSVCKREVTILRDKYESHQTTP